MTQTRLLCAAQTVIQMHRRVGPFPPRVKFRLPMTLLLAPQLHRPLRHLPFRSRILWMMTTTS
jgi:hypothetical protein